MLAGAPAPPGDLPAAATQPLALAQSGTDFAEFAHFWQRQKLENIIGAKGGQRRVGQSLPPPQLSLWPWEGRALLILPGTSGPLHRAELCSWPS